jgi:hypothetical protein
MKQSVVVKPKRNVTFNIKNIIQTEEKNNSEILNEEVNQSLQDLTEINVNPPNPKTPLITTDKDNNSVWNIRSPKDMHVKGTLPKLDFSQSKESKSSNYNSKEETVKPDED